MKDFHYARSLKITHVKFSQEFLDPQVSTWCRNIYNISLQAFFEAATSNYFKYKIEILGDQLLNHK